ncbi:hypothetical protein V6N12_019871 [Hibiscus sabdariffa]|uniref:Uncharacterized protein n=1 Tax=Hibiscus sabdariffa TaxID=183260 RepID=A0ABR2B2A7_9ROSI
MNSSCERKRELFSQLWAVTRLEESIWQQKSRAVWLAEGDRNMNSFHRQARIRLVRNGIMVIAKYGVDVLPWRMPSSEQWRMSRVWRQLVAVQEDVKVSLLDELRACVSRFRLRQGEEDRGGLGQSHFVIVTLQFCMGSVGSSFLMVTGCYGHSIYNL